MSDDRLGQLAEHFDGAAWCIIGGAGKLAVPPDPRLDWKRTRYTLGLAQQGYVVKSRSVPSLGMRTLAKLIDDSWHEAMGFGR